MHGAAAEATPPQERRQRSLGGWTRGRRRGGVAWARWLAAGLAMLSLNPAPSESVVDGCWGSGVGPSVRGSLSHRIERLRGGGLLRSGSSVDAGNAGGILSALEAEIHTLRRVPGPVSPHPGGSAGRGTAKMGGESQNAEWMAYPGDGPVLMQGLDIDVEGARLRNYESEVSLGSVVTDPQEDNSDLPNLPGQTIPVKFKVGAETVGAGVGAGSKAGLQEGGVTYGGGRLRVLYKLGVGGFGAV
ncbi:hypothetical protein T484DRAFT_1816184 [Baffinella frigidus]|nr:hypothetical protein T484DRAFT_1816184 [Cryptophyta sp. CCMP2293]